MFFPPNMTHILQPMDLMVNSSIKAFMRIQRIEMTMEYFQLFKNLCTTARRNNTPYPQFSSPAPKLVDGLQGMLRIKQDNFNDETFEQSVTRVFQSVGLAPIITAGDPNGIFVTYHGENSPSEVRKTLHQPDKIEV